MDLLNHLFGAWHLRGRRTRDPSGHTGALRPASVQRAHLALKEVDLPAGVVKLRTGEVRALLGVSGQVLHHRDPADCLDCLERWAAALNAMPPDVTMLARDPATAPEASAGWGTGRSARSRRISKARRRGWRLATSRVVYEDRTICNFPWYLRRFLPR